MIRKKTKNNNAKVIWNRVLPISSIFLLTIFSVVLVSCQSGSEKQNDSILPRPVSYMPLKKSDPVLQSLIAGSVAAWKTEPVGFDVNGRVDFVQEPGTIVHGGVFDKDKNIIDPGTLIARLQDKRYQILVDQARADIQETRAIHERAKNTYERQKRLLEKGAGAQQFVDNALAAYRSSQAQLRAAQDKLRQAQINSSDTALRAPFSGEIAKAHVIKGGYVERGEPVVTLQMMDPIKVAVAVSSDIENNINYNDLAQVYLEGHENPLQGWVWNKAPVADSVTRTFIVTLLVRNRRIDVGIPNDFSDEDIARTLSLQNFESKNNNNKPPYYLNDEAIYRDKDGHYVWKVEKRSISDLSTNFDPIFHVKKIRIELGEKSYPFMQIFTYREVVDFGTIDPLNDLVVGKLSRPIDENEKVVFSRERWLLRPGQIVNVDLSHERLAKGYYAPIQSIIKRADQHNVFIVGHSQEQGQHAQSISVQTGKSFGTFVEIIPTQENDLEDGLKLIVDGAQYIRDGDPINAFKSAEVKL